MSDETIFERDGALGRVLLNRPQVLNALSPAQFREIGRRLAVWEEDASVGLVVVEGRGDAAFSAGGDLRAVWEARARGDHAANRALFRDEYSLDRRIHRYPKPYVALMDGIVMGGGAGISVNGPFRVATERTVFAMPETAIGFFPDVGATHFLSRCPGRVGLYLGVTGTRLGGADCLWAGLATHYVPSADRGDLVAALGRAAASADPWGAAAQVLAEFHRDPGPSALAGRADSIDHCFGQPTLREIVSALVADGDDWAWDALEPIGDNSPTSLIVTFRQLTEGAHLDFEDAIRREFRMANRFLAGGDLFEGIRARIIDKDRQPKWGAATIADVAEADIAACFAPLAEELEFA
ncbi:MAG: enoyl-CoA hydratase/isomerase family protein [Magnetospirillum sp.]|nr:enoyl-CoA hydratase/isomerase family protein [Magnetospirillum sp.]